MKCTFQYYCQKIYSSTSLKQKCNRQRKKNTANKKTAFRLHEQAHTFIHIKSIFNISDGRFCTLSSSVLRHRHSCTHDTGIQDDPSPPATQGRFPEASLIYGANFRRDAGESGICGSAEGGRLYGEATVKFKQRKLRSAPALGFRYSALIQSSCHRPTNAIIKLDKNH